MLIAKAGLPGSGHSVVAEALRAQSRTPVLPVIPLASVFLQS